MESSDFETLVQLITKKMEEPNTELNVYSLFITSGNKEFKHIFNKNTFPEELWSISKVFLTLLIGILIDNKTKFDGNYFTLNSEISELVDEFKEFSNVTVYNLLTHTSGFPEPLMFSNYQQSSISILEYIYSIGFSKNSKNDFLYSNVGCYLLSIILQRNLNKNIEKLLKEHFIQKLTSTKFSWKKIDGYCLGATGLNLDIEVIHKIGLILRDGGLLYGERIVSESWVNLMTSNQVLTPNLYDQTRHLPKFAHGFNMHICKNGTFYSDAKNGQYLIINRHKDIVCTVRANQKFSNIPVTECFKGLFI
jgi:CubicO group peptidase (beta-lactamase class C family)